MAERDVVAVAAVAAGNGPAAGCWMCRRTRCKRTTARDWCCSSDASIRNRRREKMQMPTSAKCWPVVALAVGPRNSCRTGVWSAPDRNDKASCWLASPGLLSHCQTRQGSLALY